jgi:hypothetical protein
MAQPEDLSCKAATQLISAGLERPLSLFEREQLRLHLAECVLCVRYGAQLEQLRDLLRKLVQLDYKDL